MVDHVSRAFLRSVGCNSVYTPHVWRWQYSSCALRVVVLAWAGDAAGGPLCGANLPACVYGFWVYGFLGEWVRFAPFLSQRISLFIVQTFTISLLVGRMTRTFTSTVHFKSYDIFQRSDSPFLTFAAVPRGHVRYALAAMLLPNPRPLPEHRRRTTRSLVCDAGLNNERQRILPTDLCSAGTDQGTPMDHPGG